MTLKELHEALLDRERPLGQGDLGKLYQAQVQRVHELMRRLEQVDPDWLRRWRRR